MKARGAWGVGRGVVLAGMMAWAPAPAAAQGTDSLVLAAQRIARAWQRHDFGQMLAGAARVTVVFPGSGRTAPLAAAQAAEVLRGFVEGAHEESADVVELRTVGADRSYVEIERVFAPRGSAELRQQIVYVELRRAGSGFTVAEVRINR